MPLKATVSEFSLVVVEKDQSTEISIPVSFSTNWLGGGEAVAYPSSTLKYSTAYSVLRMTSATAPVSIPSTVSFTTPASPTRITSALGSLDSKTGKKGEISLSGIGFPPSTDFTILVRELDALSQPTGSPIELSSSFAADGSSTSHTMTTPIFGETSSKLQFDKSYVITDLSISEVITVVDSDVTFKVPAEPSRLKSVGLATYSNQDREVSVSLSGIKLSGTYWLVLESSTSAPDVNVSVSFSESGIGELKGILYSKALPSSMNMTFDTLYKIVGMEDSSQNPIFFENGLTFFTMKEPSRVVSASIERYENKDKEAIISVEGILLNDLGGYNVTLSLDNSETIIQASTQTSGGWESRVNLKGADETGTGLIYGKTYSLSKVIRLSDSSEMHSEEISLTFMNEPSRLVKVESGSTSDLNTISIVLSTRQLTQNQPYRVTLTGTPKDASTSNTAHEVVIEVNGAPTITESASLYPVQTVKYNHVYTVSSMNLSSSATSIFINTDACSFSTPVEPTRITSALGSLDTETGKAAEIDLTGIRFPQSTDFTILVQELDVLSQPTGSPIELSSSFAADGSSTSHTMTTPIFGETSAKLQFDKSYVITDLSISEVITVVDSDVTFKVPAEPSRLKSVGLATYSNQDREVSASLSGIKLSGTYWIVLESSTSAPEVNVSVSFSESGIGELKGILYSKALPSSMNMTFDTLYKIVGMEDSSQNPIFFENGLTFFTKKEPTRIEDGKCRLNSLRDKVIVTLTGRVLSPGDYSVVLTHSDPSKTRTITGSVNTAGNVECSHTVDANEEDSLVFGETYSISSASRDGTAIHVTSGLTLQIPHPPKVKGASFSYPSSLHTSCIVTLSGTDLDLQGTYSVALIDGPSFTILFNAETEVTSLPLLIGFPSTLQFDTNYTLESITNVSPEKDTVLPVGTVWFKTGVKPTNLTLHVDENTGNDELFCGESSSPCATVDFAWKIASDVKISKVEMKIKNSTTQSTSLVVPSNGFLILSKDQLAGPTLLIPSAASMGERKGMIEVKEATVQISNILVLIESVSDSFVFVFGDSSSVLLTSCSIVGSAQTSNSQELPEDMCSWSSGSVRLVDCTTSIDTAKLTHLSQGAINMEGGHLSFEAGSFHDNTPSDSAFPSFRRNIHCSNAGLITIESLSSGDGSGEKHPHFWISENDCSLSGEDAQPDTPLFIPTLSSGSKSTLDKKTKVFSIEISGSVLIPCGLWLEIVEITKSKTEGNTTQLELTSETCTSLTENSISLDIPPSLVKDLDSSLEWRGRLIFGNDVRSSTSFVIQKSSSDRLSEAVRDNMKWWIPLVIVLVVALLVFIVILVLCHRRRKTTKPKDATAATEMDVDVVEKMEVADYNFFDQNHVHTSHIGLNLSELPAELDTLEHSTNSGSGLPPSGLEAVEVLVCDDTSKVEIVMKKETLFERLHGQNKQKVDAVTIGRSIVKGLTHLNKSEMLSVSLAKWTPHWILFDAKDRVCIRLQEETGFKVDQNGNSIAVDDGERWRAPEQMNGQLGNDNERMSVFRLGLVLLEMRTGQVPFGEIDATNASRQICAGLLPPHSQVDEDFMSIVRDCLTITARERPLLNEIDQKLASYSSSQEHGNKEERKIVGEVLHSRTNEKLVDK